MGIFLWGVENRESCRRGGELLFGMGNSRSGVGHLLLGWGVFGDTTLVWAIVVPVWGVCLWCGKLQLEWEFSF